jgi:steroid 5-alpha reductase family enzyme
MSILITILILFAISLACTAIGFRNPVHFVSIGYAFSIVVMAVVTALLNLQPLRLLVLLHSAALVVWGLRLGVFLVRREMLPTYQTEKKDVESRYGRPTWWLKIVIWLLVSLLYVVMYSPALFANLTPEISAESAAPWQLGGIAVMTAALILETVADQQKSVYKQLHPRDFCDRGLYAWVRCPNYFGEIIFWIGSWIAGIPFYTTLER